MPRIFRPGFRRREKTCKRRTCSSCAVVLRAGQPKEKFPFANLVRQAQESGSEFVDCDALEVGDDEVHFTAKGQIDLGRLFADKLHAMMSQGKGER
jgi:hypothetical protein